MRRRQSELVRQRDGFRVEVIFVAGATRLLTLSGDVSDAPADHYQGAIVKIIPRADSTPEERDALRRRLLEAGALHAWVAPRAAAPDPVNRKARQALAPAQSPRALIDQMIDEAHTRDRELLRQVVDAALAQAGMG